jgi:hypothetical protein
MAFIIPPGRNRVISMAFAGLAKQYAAEKKASKPVAKPEVARPKENAVESEPYRRLVAMGPCKNCQIQGFSQAAHEPPSGKSIKQDDRGCFALCCNRPGPKGIVEGCHPKFDRYELFNHAKTHRMAKQWGAETRQEIDDAGLWPKKVAKWPRGKK